MTARKFAEAWQAATEMAELMRTMGLHNLAADYDEEADMMHDEFLYQSYQDAIEIDPADAAYEEAMGWNNTIYGG